MTGNRGAFAGHLGIAQRLDPGCLEMLEPADVETEAAEAAPLPGDDQPDRLGRGIEPRKGDLTSAYDLPRRPKVR